VIIIGRGGGSLEDLWPFNEEAVVRAVFATRTPVVSAVGHEIDFALTDFAADVRAATPSQAAERVVQEHAALAERVNRAGRHLAAGLRNRLERAQHRLRDLYRSVVFQRPEELLRNRRQTADDLRLRLEAANADALALRRRRVENAGRSLALLSPRNQVRRAHDRLLALEPRLAQGGRHATERGRVRLQGLGRQLHALSPLAVLGRGYALAQKLPEKSVVRRAADVAPGDELLIQFGEGAARAEIRGIEESDGKTEF
jgi:exodeoxyribonuclease VII large subunit